MNNCARVTFVRKTKRPNAFDVCVCVMFFGHHEVNDRNLVERRGVFFKVTNEIASLIFAVTHA